MNEVHTSIEDEYTALRNGCGLIDYQGIGLFQVQGPGAIRFLNEVTTRNIEFLLEEQSSTALVLDDAGHVISDVLVHCQGTEFLVEVEPARRARTWEHLRAVAESLDYVELTDVSPARRVFGVEGPASFRIAQHFLSFPVSSLAYRGFTTVRWRDHELLLSRTGVTGEYGYKFHIDAAGAEELRQELRSLGALPVGSAALDICRTEMRFVDLDAEGGRECFPFEVGLQWMVDMHHDFRGKEALARRIDEGFPRRPVCWTADPELAAPPAPGTALSIEGQPVGEVTHAVRSPGLGRVIGTARLDETVAAVDVELTLAGATSPAVRTVSAPFLIPASFNVKPE